MFNENLEVKLADFGTSKVLTSSFIDASYEGKQSLQKTSTGF